MGGCEAVDDSGGLEAMGCGSWLVVVVSGLEVSGTTMARTTLVPEMLGQ